MLVFQRDFRLLAEGHGEIEVEAAIGHDRHRQGIDQTFPRKAAAEEVAQRAFHRGHRLVIPIDAQHQVAQHEAVGLGRLVIHRDPDMIDFPGAFHFGQRHGRAGGNIEKAGAAFAGRAQMAGGHAALSLFAMGVFCVNGTAAGMFGQRQTAQPTGKG